MNTILSDSSGVNSQLRPDVVIPCRLVTPFAHQKDWWKDDWRGSTGDRIALLSRCPPTRLNIELHSVYSCISIVTKDNNYKAQNTFVI